MRDGKTSNEGGCVFPWTLTRPSRCEAEAEAEYYEAEAKNCETEANNCTQTRL